MPDEERSLDFQPKLTAGFVEGGRPGAVKELKIEIPEHADAQEGTDRLPQKLQLLAEPLRRNRIG